MPTRSSKPRRPRDPNALAKLVVDIATGEVEDRPAAPRDSGEKNPHAVALGRLGGKKGGAARAAKLSPKQRSRIASAAAKKRWSTDNSDTPLLTLSQVREWEARKADLEQQMRAMQDELASIVRKFDAASVFVRIQNGHAEPPGIDKPAGDQAPTETIVDAIIRVVGDSRGSAMGPSQIKAALKASGFNVAGLEANPGYLYTVLGRLLKRGKLEKRRGAYRVPARSSSPQGETGAVAAPART